MMTYRAGFTYIHAFFLIPNLLFSGWVSAWIQGLQLFAANH